MRAESTAAVTRTKKEARDGDAATTDRPGLLLWLNTAAKLRLLVERGVVREEMTVRPEDTLRWAGISNKRQAEYQRRMSSLLAGRP